MAKHKPESIARKPLNIMPAERPIIDALRIYQPVDEHDTDPLIKSSDMLKEVTSAVRNTGGKGEVSIVIKLSGEGKNVAMTVECKAKTPVRPAPKRLVYAAENGEIVTHDPDQYEFMDQLHKGSVPASETNAD